MDGIDAETRERLLKICPICSKYFSKRLRSDRKKFSGEDQRYPTLLLTKEVAEFYDLPHEQALQMEIKCHRACEKELPSRKARFVSRPTNITTNSLRLILSGGPGPVFPPQSEPAIEDVTPAVGVVVETPATIKNNSDKDLYTMKKEEKNRTAISNCMPPKTKKIKMATQHIEIYDNVLLGLAGQCGGIQPLLAAFFSFLHRTTDFYVVHADDDSQAKMGFRAGAAEKILLQSFRKFPYKPMPPRSSGQQQPSRSHQGYDGGGSGVDSGGGGGGGGGGDDGGGGVGGGGGGGGGGGASSTSSSTDPAAKQDAAEQKVLAVGTAAAALPPDLALRSPATVVERPGGWETAPPPPRAKAGGDHSGSARPPPATAPAAPPDTAERKGPAAATATGAAPQPRRRAAKQSGGEVPVRREASLDRPPLAADASGATGPRAGERPTGPGTPSTPTASARPCILCGKRQGPRKRSGGRDKIPTAPASRAVAELAELPYDHLKGLGFCHSKCQEPDRLARSSHEYLPYAPHVVALRMQIRSQVRRGGLSSAGLAAPSSLGAAPSSAACAAPPQDCNEAAGRPASGSAAPSGPPPTSDPAAAVMEQ